MKESYADNREWKKKKKEGTLTRKKERKNVFIGVKTLELIDFPSGEASVIFPVLYIS